MKTAVVLRFLMLLLTLTWGVGLSIPVVHADWVPDDEGSLHWYDPPEPTPPPQLRLSSAKMAAAGSINAEVLFLMDTSGSMSDEFDALCSKITEIVTGLQANGIAIDHQILGITGNRDCTTDTVDNIIGPDTVDHSEDWGPAVEDVSRQSNYPWKSGYVRVAIPMSDEGAENGDSWDTADDAAIDRAKAQCSANAVAVVPIIGTFYNASEGPKILAGAQELADDCWGDVYRSSDPTNTLVAAITNAILDLIDPTPHDLSVDLWVDDAFATLTVNKLPGDIAYLVAQATNGEAQSDTVDLTFTFPAGWKLADKNGKPVVKRSRSSADEISLGTTDYTYTDGSGKVVISNVTVPPLSGDANNVARSDQYVVKVIIPKNHQSPTPTIPVEVLLESTTSTSSDTHIFKITLLGEDDSDTMIVTNRSLLYEYYGDTDEMDQIFNTLYQIAGRRSGVVRYVDWWDRLDDFSTVPCNGNVADWDRGDGTENNKINYATQTEEAINAVPICIDNYTHYWGSQLKGSDWQNEDLHLMLVGDDIILPFYRYQDSSGTPTTVTHGHLPYQIESWYGPTTHLENAGEHNYILSDIRYSDTDNNDWGDGDTDRMYVGRVMTGGDVESLRKVLNSINSEEESSVYINGDHTLTTAGEGSGSFRFGWIAATIIDNIFEDSGYGLFESIINRYAKNDEIIDDLDNVLNDHVLDHWVYRGHGNNTMFSAELRGKSISFANESPLLTMSACLMGLADWDGASNSRDHFVYEALSRGANTLIGATTFTDRGYNNRMLKDLIQYATGARDDGVFGADNDVDPFPIGRALNEAKTDNNSGGSDTSDTHVSYTLYGAPWKTFTPPDLRAPKTAPRATQQMLEQHALPYQKIQQTSSALTHLQEETIDNWEIVDVAGFDVVQIDAYDDLTRGVLTTPVVPVKHIEVLLPKDTVVTSVNVVRTDSHSLGNLDIPVFYDAPSVEGIPLPDPYQAAPDSIGVFNAAFETRQYERGGNLVVAVDVYPLSYDAVSNQATLHQAWTLTVDYTTEHKGIVRSAQPQQFYANVGEVINASVWIENISSAPHPFTVVAELVSDVPGSTAVDTQTQTLALDPATPTQLLLPLTTPIGGGYWVKIRVDDGVNEIGKSMHHIHVGAGSITALTISRVIPGQQASFDVTFSNTSAQAVEAQFFLDLYQGSTQVSSFVPIVHTVPGNSEQTSTFLWSVPSDFPAGNYLAVARVLGNGSSSSKSQSFAIGQMDQGWNLVSFNQRPATTDIATVLQPLTDLGAVDAVWAYQNGVWHSYFPASPGFSDLTEITSGWGYWINLNRGVNFSIIGIQAPNAIALEADWNLTGYNGATEVPIDTALSSIAHAVLDVWSYQNGVWKFYDPAQPGFSDLLTMKPGWGYWLETNQAISWTMP